VRTVSVAIVTVLLLASPVAFACSALGGFPPLAERLKEADAVFVAHLIATREIRSADLDIPQAIKDEFDPEEANGPVIRGEFRLLETLKGQVPATGHVYDLPLGPGNCSLGLMAGWDYVFVVPKPDEDMGDLWFVTWPTGSAGLGPYREQGDPDPEELASIRKLLDAAQPEQSLE